MNEWRQWEVRKQLEQAARALEKNGFAASVCATRAEAADRVMELAADAVTVGFGGSVTLGELDLPRRLTEAGKQCLVHGVPDLSLEERLAIMRRQLTCDLFLTGANAVTLDGKLVNIDATGNRVGAMAFGPKKVVVVAGANKLAPDAETGIKRVRAWASPANAYRLAMKTPCAQTGFCADCDSPQRICRIVHVMERCPRLTNITVLLVEEALGL